MSDVYEKLRQRLDDMATGYPPSADGVEIKILKRLFSEADAEMFLMMTPMLETPETVAERLNLDPAQTATHLEDMAYRGLLFRQRKADMVRYATIPFVVGVFEFQLKKVDKELAHDLQAYYEEALGKTFAAHNTAVMRTIPINRRLVEEWPVAPYEDVLGIFDQQKTIAVAPCICRTTQKKLGKGCDKPLEACFLFGSHAQYYVDNHMGRFIDKEEAKELVKINEAAGLGDAALQLPACGRHVQLLRGLLRYSAVSQKTARAGRRCQKQLLRRRGGRRTASAAATASTAARWMPLPCRTTLRISTWIAASAAGFASRPARRKPCAW